MLASVKLDKTLASVKANSAEFKKGPLCFPLFVHIGLQKTVDFYSKNSANLNSDVPVYRLRSSLQHP